MVNRPEEKLSVLQETKGLLQQLDAELKIDATCRCRMGSNEKTVGHQHLEKRLVMWSIVEKNWLV